ncbi:MAG: SAM-dependent methyltransferase, partial [Planctomycetota bacterium]|nr:SAM-dependent methyltransferase [Planctomycetota bacterium]
CDAATSKQSKYMPGSHIPILSPDTLDDYRPDFVLILPWNIASEIREKLSALRKAGTQFVTPIPRLDIQ